MHESFPSEEIYKRVERLRKERCWSLYMLAKKAGVSVNSLYHWRDKKSSPTVYLLAALAEAFNVSIARLLMDAETLDGLTTEQRLLTEKWSKLSRKQQETVMKIIEAFEANE